MSSNNNYNPNGIGLINNNIFGFPYSKEESEIFLLPISWDVTTSYNPGTSDGPEAILKASPQLDFFHQDYENAWEIQIYMDEISEFWKNKNIELRQKTDYYISKLSIGETIYSNAKLLEIKNEINEWSSKLNEWIKEKCEQYLNENKIVGIIGGDHSVSFGLIHALSKKYNSFGILQIDANADLRDAFEDLEYSHASAMNNALKFPQVEKLVQVAIRDYCIEEEIKIKNSNNKIISFADNTIKSELYEGNTWKNICDKIISQLPENIYISFDIDGLDPKLCPNTGTPVPGGLEFEQAIYLIKKITEANKKIIGFDLCEVAPGSDEWDANVGARIIYNLCVYSAKTFYK